MMNLLLMLLAPPPEAEVQGLYEGTIRDSKVEARVVAMGKGAYKIFVRPEKGAKLEMDGKTDGDAVAFVGGELKASYAGNGKIQGENVELRRVYRKPPSMGKKPPSGAIVLLDGKNFEELDKQGEAAEDGSIQVPKGGMNSKRKFEGNIDLHVEFMCPLMPSARGQGRGNSGVFVPNGEEIQVLDSFGMDTYKGGGCGGLYNYKDPDAFDVFSLASLPPLEWQTYDVEYRVAEGKARVTVWHNGIKIHDAAEMKKPPKKGGLHFQDHGNPVRFRNIWVVPLG